MPNRRFIPPPPYGPGAPSHPDPNDNTFARLIDQLNFSNMTISNLSHQMSEMRSEMQALHTENSRLGDELRSLRIQQSMPQVSTPNSARFIRENESIVQNDYENGQPVAPGGDIHISGVSEHPQHHLTISEVEAAFYEFSGTDIYSVEKWILDFDEMADSVGLSDLRKFVLAKKK